MTTDYPDNDGTPSAETYALAEYLSEVLVNFDPHLDPEETYFLLLDVLVSQDVQNPADVALQLRATKATTSSPPH